MSDFKSIVANETPTLVDFYADWCGPCQSMIPVLDEVKKRMGDQIRILKINVDKNPQAAAAFQVRGVPTFILFKSGHSVWKKSGAMPASELENMIQPHLK